MGRVVGFRFALVFGSMTIAMALGSVFGEVVRPGAGHRGLRARDGRRPAWRDCSSRRCATRDRLGTDGGSAPSVHWRPRRARMTEAAARSDYDPMTERPEGTPEEAPADPVEPAEPIGATPEPDASRRSPMRARARGRAGARARARAGRPASRSPSREPRAVEPEPEPEAERRSPSPSRRTRAGAGRAGAGARAEPEPEPEPDRRAEAEPEPTTAAAAAAAATSGRSAARAGATPQAPAPAPRPDALRAGGPHDRQRRRAISSSRASWSSSAILLYGLLVGHGGFLTHKPSPTPVPTLSAEPSASSSAGRPRRPVPAARRPPRAPPRRPPRSRRTRRRSDVPRHRLGAVGVAERVVGPVFVTRA